MVFRSGILAFSSSFFEDLGGPIFVDGGWSKHISRGVMFLAVANVISIEQAEGGAQALHAHERPLKRFDAEIFRLVLHKMGKREHMR